MTDRQQLAIQFEAQRGRLRAVAHQLVGSPSVAEDVVQEAWLRLDRTDASTIRNLDAWLTTVVSRLALDHLRSAARRRERAWQIEPWQEPVTDTGNPEEEISRQDAVGVALLVVLDTLGPAERLAFVLHDVFGRPFEEIATVLDRTPAAARQLASRARRRVRGAPPTVRADRAWHRRVVDAWLAAVQGGDLSALVALLDDDVVLTSDAGAGGTRVISGAQQLARQAAGFAAVAARAVPVLIDGRPGVMAVDGGRVLSLMAFEITGGRITRLDVLADPARLATVDLPG
ncbi:sigma-70 family RNA polymerase sigma factor [Georgenia sp. MJ173]|uniref:sigma-70 family RNA polymerase sigma factor n=1 Tax=Georgenia sunbinii TaxID=3117728 RepID=UPI002F264E37